MRGIASSRRRAMMRKGTTLVMAMVQLGEKRSAIDKLLNIVLLCLYEAELCSC